MELILLKAEIRDPPGRKKLPRVFLREDCVLEHIDGRVHIYVNRPSVLTFLGLRSERVRLGVLDEEHTRLVCKYLDKGCVYRAFISDLPFPHVKESQGIHVSVWVEKR